MLKLPFWLIILYWSFKASTATPWFEIESVPVNIKDLILISVACFYCIVPTTKKNKLNSIHKPWHFHLPLLTTMLAIYAAISTQWSGMSKVDTTAMLYTLIVIASTCLLGYFLISKLDFKLLPNFIWYLTIFIGLIGLLYTFQSFFSLGLSTTNDYQLDEFGIQRVRGPLFGSTTGFFILIPALGFAIDEILQRQNNRIFKLFVLFSIIITLIGLGSRTAFFLMGILFILITFLMKDKKKAMKSLVVVLLVTVLAVLIFYSRAKTDRLQNFEDTSRSDTYTTSLQIIQHRSELTNVLGSGYGSYWPWYIPDVEGPRETNRYFDLVWNPYGSLLYHPHSTLLLCLVELGIPGLVYFVTLWLALTAMLLKAFKKSSYPIFSCSLFASGFSMFFDFFIFRTTIVNTLWWIFLFSALCLNYCYIPTEKNIAKNKNGYKFISGKKELV